MYSRARFRVHAEAIESLFGFPDDVVVTGVEWSLEDQTIIFSLLGRESIPVQIEGEGITSVVGVILQDKPGITFERAK